MMPWSKCSNWPRHFAASESTDGRCLQQNSELTAQDCQNSATAMNPPCARGPLTLHSLPEWQAWHALPADSSVCKPKNQTLHKRQVGPLGRGLVLASKVRFSSWQLSRGPLPATRRFGAETQCPTMPADTKDTPQVDQDGPTFNGQDCGDAA